MDFQLVAPRFKNIMPPPLMTQEPSHPMTSRTQHHHLSFIHLTNPGRGQPPATQKPAPVQDILRSI
jgi:hypothetical protein